MVSIRSLLVCAMLCLVASASSIAQEPAFEGKDRKFVDHVKALLAEHRKTYFYICPNPFGQTVLRSSSRELTKPGGKHPSAPPPLPDKAMAMFDKPSEEAIAHARALMQTHNDAITDPNGAKKSPKNAQDTKDKPRFPGNTVTELKPAEKVDVKPVAALKGRTLPGQPGPTDSSPAERVQKLTYSADGTRLVAWTLSTVVVWDLQRKEPVFESRRSVSAMRWTATQGNFITFTPADAYKKAKTPLPDKKDFVPRPMVVETRLISSGKLRPPIKLPQPKNQAEMVDYVDLGTSSISPDGRWVASAGFSRHPSARKPISDRQAAEQVEVVDTATGSIRFRLNPKYKADFDAAGQRQGQVPRIWITSFSNDSQYLAAASSDGALTVWDMRTGKETAVFRYEGGFDQLDGRDALVWIGGHDSVLVPVRAPTGFARCDMSTRKLIPLGHDKSEGVNGVPRKDLLSGSAYMTYAFTPDASRVAYNSVEPLSNGSPNSSPMIFDDLKGGEYIGRIPGIEGDHVTELTYSPDGSHLAIGTMKGHIVVYAVSDLDKLAKRQQRIPAS